MYSVMFVQRSGLPTILHGKNFTVICYLLKFQPNSFIFAMLVGTVRCDHFILHMMTLTLAEGNKVNRKQNLWDSFSLKVLN